MNILPKQYSDFLDKQYWNNFFEEIKKVQPDQEYFQWYGSFVDHRKIIEKLIDQKHRVLNIGCGKSLLGQHISDAIHCEIISCDYSEKIISEMQERPQTKLKNLRYEVANSLQPHYENESFDIVIDKGTLDALFPQDTNQNREKIEDCFFKNIVDILKKQKGSKYIVVSMLQEHILKLLFHYFNKLEHWEIHVYEQVLSDSQSLHPWIVSVEYVQKSKHKIHLTLLNKDTIKGSPQNIEKQINSIQVQARFGEKMKSLRLQQKFSLNIYDKDRQVRFMIQVMDSPVVKILNKNKCGVYIVPQGKQTTFLYGTEKGLSLVVEQIGMSRLILVKLVSGNTYESIESIKKQLNSVVTKLLPKGCLPNQVPYMTDNDQLGDREYLYQDKQHIVEQVRIDDSYYRRLVISANRGTIQTQYLLSYFNQKNPLKQHLKAKQNQKSMMPKKKGTFIGLDLEQMNEGYERAVLGGLMLLPDQIVQQAKVLMLGGGGCIIPNFLANSIKQVDITVVEIDKKIIEIARQYFEVNQSDSFRQVHDDALKFVEKKSKDQKNKYDIIIFDINGLEGQSSPPPTFLSHQFLTNVKKLLSPEGMLIFHMINHKVPTIFKQLFNPIYIWSENLVDILFCFNQQLVRREDPISKKQVIVTNATQVKNNPKRKKRWGWQQQAYQNIKLYWPKAGGIFDGTQIFYQNEDQLKNNSQSQLKEDLQKVNKKKKKKK